MARFVFEKQKLLARGPIFCDFVIQNTGMETFAFPYRPPSRVLNQELESEPRFRVETETGHRLPDPAPLPCGGAKGSAVYGYVTLPPGQTHHERWLVNQWARFSRPGRYRLKAQRRLPLWTVNPAGQRMSEQPTAYALAIDELTFEVTPATEKELRAAFESYTTQVSDPRATNLDEAVMVLTTLPQPFLLPELKALAGASAQERRWDRDKALEGLARLGTRPAWEYVLRIARGEKPRNAIRPAALEPKDASLRAYAILLLGERADPRFLPGLFDMVSTAPDELRGDVLRSLGFFHDPQANEILFEKLHAARASDRMNAILGLKNLESKDAIPALLAMLDDPDREVRQVANFALQSLTGQKFALPVADSRPDLARTSRQWHAWWREHSSKFVPTQPAPCRDW